VEKMNYKVIYDEQDAIVIATTEEAFTHELMAHMAPEIARTVKEHQCFHILIDFRRSPISMSTLKIYEVPKKLAEIFAVEGINIITVKRAVLITQKNEDYAFLETVSENQSHQFKLFYDMDAAKKWLKG
jgi:hypothetical protein